MMIRPYEPIKLTSISQSNQNLEEAESNIVQLINQGNNFAFWLQFNLCPPMEKMNVANAAHFV